MVAPIRKGVRVTDTEDRTDGPPQGAQHKARAKQMSKPGTQTPLGLGRGRTKGHVSKEEEPSPAGLPGPRLGAELMQPRGSEQPLPQSPCSVTYTLGTRRIPSSKL